MINKWQEKINELPPITPFEKVLSEYQNTYNNWDIKKLGPPPACFPTSEDLENSNCAQFIKKNNLSDYEELLRLSQNKRNIFLELFFKEKNFQFFKQPECILATDSKTNHPHWLPGAEFNIFESCFLASPQKTALTFQVEGECARHWNFEELYKNSTQIASGLKKLGFKKGDSIAIDMVMTAECVAIYLGIIAMGGVVVSIADSFAPEEISIRLKISNAKAIFTQDFILRGDKKIPLYEKVCLAQAPIAIVLSYNMKLNASETPLRDGDLFWKDFLKQGQPCEWKKFETEKMNSESYLNILFSSGTTGEPKAIPWTHTTPFKCAMDSFFHHNIKPTSICCWPTNVGWMMGPWLIFAALMNQSEIALYYGAPHTLDFCKFIEKNKITFLGIIPSLLKAWINSKVLDQCDWTNIKVLSSTGECSSPNDMLYLIHKTGFKPIIEYCGGTEIGGGYLTGTVIQPCSPSTFSTPALGSQFIILDESEKETQNGEVFLIPPSLGLSNTLLNKDHNEVYYKDSPELNDIRLRKHGDQVEYLGNGYYKMHGRVDDTMNLGGIKTSSAEIERTLNTLPNIHETAAIAIPPKEGGPSLLIIFCILKNKDTEPNTKELLLPLMQKRIKVELNPLFKINQLIIRESLPRTASNKVMRKELRKIALKKL